MIRILLSYVIPLVLPAIGWYVWQRFRPQKSGQEVERKGWAAAPWPQLSVAGVILLALTLGSIAVFVGGSPGETYVPARLIDGKVVPGTYDESGAGN